MTKKQCENTDHKGKHTDVKTVNLTADFDNETCDWCATCRERDNDMIIRVNFCPHCGEDLKKWGVYETQTVDVKYPMKWCKENKNFDYKGKSEELESHGDQTFYCANCNEEIDTDNFDWCYS